MLTSRYSAPDFNPYGDEYTDEPDALWPAPSAQGALVATLSLPGSKSLTARELILSALSDGSSRLCAPLHSQDTDHMVSALRALGVVIEEKPGTGHFGPDLEITPPTELIGSTTIDCGQAGTVMRFVPPVAALALGPTSFDADASARSRPIESVITALRSLGVDISDEGRGKLPFTIHGRGSVRGGETTIDASLSSQFVSSLLLSASRFEEGLTLHHVGERLPSLPHIDMTIAALAARGIRVESPEEGHWHVAPGVPQSRTVTIEPDLSNAAPFLAAAVATRGHITLTGWPEMTTQVGSELLDLLPHFGATVERVGTTVTVSGPERILGVELDLHTGGELAPALVALSALADEPSVFTGIGHIRHHETDRLATLTHNITALGGDVTEDTDGLTVRPRPLRAGVWNSYDDHRIATAGAIIGLAVPGIEIENIRSTAKTLPQFTELWAGLFSPEPQPR